MSGFGDWVLEQQEGISKKKPTKKKTKINKNKS